MPLGKHLRLTRVDDYRTVVIGLFDFLFNSVNFFDSLKDTPVNSVIDYQNICRNSVIKKVFKERLNLIEQFKYIYHIDLKILKIQNKFVILFFL